MGVLIGSSLVFPNVDVMCVTTFFPFLLDTPEWDGFGEQVVSSHTSPIVVDPGSSSLVLISTVPSKTPHQGAQR